MCAYIIEIERKHLSSVIKLGISKKNFKYVAKDNVLKFNRSFVATLEYEGSKYLKRLECDNILDKNHPLVGLWNKVQVAIGYNLEFMGVSIYYGMFLKNDATK